MKRGKIQSELIRELCVDEKNSIRISRTMREGENKLCVDIRTFKLYPIDGHYDGTLKATPNGVTISLDQLPLMISSLCDIYEEEYGKEFVRSDFNE